MRSVFLKAFVVFLSGTLLVTNVVGARAAIVNNDAGFAPLFVDALVRRFPQDAGTIRKIVPPLHPNGRVVIAVQDVHGHLEAQRNIRKLLWALIDHHNIDLVALEGAFGPIDLSWAQQYSDQNAVLAVADYLLKERRISGPGYVGIAARSRLKSLVGFPQFVGIDDQFHYAANIRAYRNAVTTTTDRQRQIDKWSRELETAKKLLLPAALQQFDQKMQRYRTGSVSWGEHVRDVVSFVRSIPSSVKDFLSTLDLEEKIDPEAVRSEQFKMLGVLITKLSSMDAHDLIQREKAFGTGLESSYDFYSYLRTLCLSKHIDMGAYPHWNRYLTYLRISNQLDINAVVQDVDQLTKQVYSSLVTAHQQRHLLELSHWLELTQKLLTFELTKAEWREFQKISSELVGSDSRFQAHPLKPFENFYREAEIRDQRMANNLEKAISESQARVALVVTGGFHTEGIMNQLQRDGITVISFVPKVTQLGHEPGSAYLKAFVQNKTALDLLFTEQSSFLAQAPFSNPTVTREAFDLTSDGFKRRQTENVGRHLIVRVNSNARIVQDIEAIDRHARMVFPKRSIHSHFGYLVTARDYLNEFLFKDDSIEELAAIITHTQIAAFAQTWPIRPMQILEWIKDLSGDSREIFLLLDHHSHSLSGFASVDLDQRHLTWLAINPRKQIKGLGTFLLDHVFAWARQQGYQSLDWYAGGIASSFYFGFLNGRYAYHFFQDRQFHAWLTPGKLTKDHLLQQEQLRRLIEARRRDVSAKMAAPGYYKIGNLSDMDLMDLEITSADDWRIDGSDVRKNTICGWLTYDTDYALFDQNNHLLIAPLLYADYTDPSTGNKISYQEIKRAGTILDAPFVRVLSPVLAPAALITSLSQTNSAWSSSFAFAAYILVAVSVLLWGFDFAQEGKPADRDKSQSEQIEIPSFETSPDIADILTILGFNSQRDIDQLSTGSIDAATAQAAQKNGFVINRIKLPDDQLNRYQHLWNETADSSYRQFDFVYDASGLVAILPYGSPEVLAVQQQVLQLDQQIAEVQKQLWQDLSGSLHGRYEQLQDKIVETVSRIQTHLRYFELINYGPGTSNDDARLNRHARLGRYLKDLGLRQLMSPVFASNKGYTRLIYSVDAQGQTNAKSVDVFVDETKPAHSSNDGNTFQIDLRLFPTVYPPLNASNAVHDRDYYEAVLSFRQSFNDHQRVLKRTGLLRPIKNICVVGAGSGADLVAVYWAWLREQGVTPEQAFGQSELQPTIHVRDINPFAVEGLKQVVKQLGLVKCQLEVASGIPEKGYYDLVIWNMPAAGGSTDESPGRLAGLHDYGENGNQMIRQVQENLPNILNDRGMAIFWNVKFFRNMNLRPPAGVSIQKFFEGSAQHRTGLSVSVLGERTYKIRYNDEVYVITQDFAQKDLDKKPILPDVMSKLRAERST